jgi:hypothetical protein
MLYLDGHSKDPFKKSAVYGMYKHEQPILKIRERTDKVDQFEVTLCKTTGDVETLTLDKRTLIREVFDESAPNTLRYFAPYLYNGDRAIRTVPL